MDCWLEQHPDLALDFFSFVVLNAVDLGQEEFAGAPMQAVGTLALETSKVDLVFHVSK